MRSKKKILIIVAIVLVIIISLAGTALGMILTGKVAITSKQKLAKGLKDLTGEISTESLKEYEKLYTTPFEVKNTIKANVNKMEIEDSSELQEMLEEVKNVVKDTTITNTLQADLKNNIIKENLKLNLADVIQELSAEVEYNTDRISLRSKELNEKYITFTKEDIGPQAVVDYGDLSEVFELFENICNNKKSNLSLTDDEKAHFENNYKDIFSNYITDDMIKEERATITVDGQNKECDNVNFTLNANQISELLGIYIDKLNKDAEGKKIIVDKLKSISSSFEEEDLQETIDELKDELSYLDEDINIKVSIYCTMLETYGINIKVAENDDTAVEFNMIIGKTNNVITIMLPMMDISVKSEDKRNEMVIEFYDEEEDTELKFTLVNEIIAKTENTNNTKSTIGLIFKQGENDIDITLNIDSNLMYLSSIQTTQMQNSNSLNIVNDSEDLQNYLSEITNNLTTIMQNATQNSKLVKSIYELVNNSNNLIGTVQPTSKEFNNMFQDYTGNLNDVSVKTLLQKLATSNETNTMHKISVSIVENEVTILNPTTQSQEISSATINVNPNNQYTILVTSLDDEGYITGIQIKKV